MEFEDHEEHEEEEEEDEEEEITLPVGYDSLGNSSRVKMSNSGGEATALTLSPPTARKPRYRECLKNHAVSIGGHAVDGCGEFMPAGTEGTLDALKCAACNCHRNFHRKETDVSGIGGLITSGELLYHHHNQQQFSPFYRPPAGYLHVTPHHRPLALPSPLGEGRGTHSREDEEDISNPRGGGGVGGMMMGTGSSKKRFRTKFTPEQKERMMELAERLGWSIQKHDEAVVQQFCNDTGVKRHVLKVWMHNNKHTIGKKPAA